MKGRVSTGYRLVACIRFTLITTGHKGQGVTVAKT